MRCILVVVTTFPESLLPAMRVPEQLAWSPTDSWLAELVGCRSKTRPAFPIPLQIRACCICTTKYLECRDSQLGSEPHRLLAEIEHEYLWITVRDDLQLAVGIQVGQGQR